MTATFVFDTTQSRCIQTPEEKTNMLTGVVNTTFNRLPNAVHTDVDVE